MSDIGRTHVTEYTFGPVKLELEQVENVQARVLAAQLSRTEPPHGGVLWPSAKALAHVFSLAGTLEGKRVIELGCGVGAVSIVSARLGAEVVASDISDLAMALTRRNAQRNRVDVSITRFDVHEPPEDLGSFDVICAADVLYEEGMLRGVLRFMKRHLRQDGHGVVADPNRALASGIMGAARLFGFETRVIPLCGGPSIAGGVTVYDFYRRAKRW